MDVIIKANPPFIIKTYDHNFTISEKLNESDVIKYNYDQLKSVATKYGELNWFVSIDKILLSIFLRNNSIRPENIK